MRIDIQKAEHVTVAILENGRHLGFSTGQSYRMDLITIEMSHARFGDCINICTIHPKMHRGNWG